MLELIIFSLSILYYELVLKIATVQSFVPNQFVILLLFSVSYGLLFGVLTDFFPNKMKHIIRIVLLSFLPILFYAMFLLFRSFQIFYDINTCLNGAGGAFSEFMDDILRLILDGKGLVTLFALYIPLVAYCLGIRFLKHKEIAYRKYSMALLIICYLGAIALVRLDVASKNMYRTEYAYQPVVENLGLLTGLRLDFLHVMKGEDDGTISFEAENSLQMSSTDLTNDSVSIDETGQSTNEGDEASEGKNAIEGNEALENQPNNVESGQQESQNSEEATQKEKEQTQSTATTDENAALEEEIEEETPIIPTEFTVYPHIYDIDFEALAETTSGTNKELDLYVASQTPAMSNAYTGLFAGKNLIFITAEAFSGDVIDPELTPTLYRMATKGIQFTDYYQPAVAGTTGGEYANIFGLLPTKGGKSMSEMTNGHPFLNLGHQLDALGYYGKAYHNNNIEVYNRNVTHEKLGYSDGFMGKGNGLEEVLTTNGFPSSDAEMLKGTFDTYADKQPFNIYYMTVSGHGQYGRSINQMSSKNYSRVENLPYSETVKCYIGNNLELEDAMTYLLEELERRDMADNTVVCISADHFPYGLDKDASLGSMPNLSELYGYPVTSYLERDHNRLILWCGILEKTEPIVVDSPVFSLDVLPTLSNLFGLTYDSRLLPGRDALGDQEALIFDGGYDWKTDLGTYIASKNKFIPATEDIEIPEGYVDRVKALVRNKYSFCKGVLQANYYGHVWEALSAN